jgi:hypothetical protein
MRPVNQVREDVKRLHWALCLTGAKWTYSMQGYKREYTKLFGQNLLFSRALSLSLSSSYKHLTDLSVRGGSAGQPPVGLSCFAGPETDVSDDATSPDKNCINNWRRLWERRGRSYQNKNPER